jgi:hypothetical protein
MSDSGENIPKEEKFLTAEYQALIEVDGSRNERLDRLLTMFISMAAAPWALYALTSKANTDLPSFWALPVPVSASLVLIGVVGALVTMMFIQMRLTIILYTRALNAIRGYFLEEGTKLSFHLPTDHTKPPYYEKGNYIQFAVSGMGLVNSSYLALGLYNLIHWPRHEWTRVAMFIGLGLVALYGHMKYYSYQARKRDKASIGKKELHWNHNKHN